MVEYREGKENRTADALSRREEDGETKEGELMAIYSPFQKKNILSHHYMGGHRPTGACRQLRVARTKTGV